jgi:hypothetical protein
MMVLCVFRFCGVAFGLYGWERKGKERIEREIEG